MAEGSSKTQEISLGSDFDAVVRYGGTAVELSPGGDVVVKANGAQVTIGADGSIHGLPAPANDTAAKAKTGPEVADEMEDGAILARWLWSDLPYGYGLGYG